MFLKMYLELIAWLTLSSIEVFGMLFLYAQLSNKIKIQRTEFRMRLGWGFFTGGLAIKVMLYGIEIASGNL